MTEGDYIKRFYSLKDKWKKISNLNLDYKKIENEKIVLDYLLKEISEEDKKILLENYKIKENWGHLCGGNKELLEYVKENLNLNKKNFLKNL